MKKLFVIFTGFFLLTACAELPQPETRFGDGVPNQRQVNYNGNDNFIEGEMTDIADRNPNFLNLNNDGNGNTNNRAFYEDKLEELVEASDKYNAGLIYFNGKTATVNVTPKGKANKDDAKKLEKELQLAVPRFEINVNVNNNNK